MLSSKEEMDFFTTQERNKKAIRKVISNDIKSTPLLQRHDSEDVGMKVYLLVRALLSVDPSYRSDKNRGVHFEMRLCGRQQRNVYAMGEPRMKGLRVTSKTRRVLF